MIYLGLSGQEGVQWCLVRMGGVVEGKVKGCSMRGWCVSWSDGVPLAPYSFM